MQNTKKSIYIILILLLLSVASLFYYNHYNTKEKKPNKIEEELHSKFEPTQSNLKDLTPNKDSSEFFLRSEEDVEFLLKSNKPSLIFFGSKSCSACIGTKRDAEIIYNNYDNISLGYIEVTENPELLNIFPIQQTPSVLIFDEKGDPYKFKRKDKKDLDIYYKKNEDKKIEYSVFLGIPKMKRLEKAINIITSH